MISEGYEKALFDLPVSDRLSLEGPTHQKAEGATPVITKEFDFVRDLRRVARVVRLVVASQETLFAVVPQGHPRSAIAPTRLGLALMSLNQVTQEEMELNFPDHGFNPYVDILFKSRKEVPGDTAFDCWTGARGEVAVQVASQLNDFVSHLRRKAHQREFRKLLDGYRRACDKNNRSMRLYIDAIFQHRGSKHLVIRLDLGYTMQEAWAAGRPTSVTLDEAKDHLKKFQRYLRENLPVTGFAAKLECGLLRGYHFHALIFLNGHLMQRDVQIAQRLGEYWARVICEGRGLYWNCNAQDYRERGIGMIDYTDGDKRVALVEKVAGYLTKIDFWLRYQPGGKTFFKGLMPRPRPIRGRPRESEG